MIKAQNVEENHEQDEVSLPQLLNLLIERVMIVASCAFPSSSVLLSWVTYNVTLSYAKTLMIFLISFLPVCYRIFRKKYPA